MTKYAGALLRWLYHEFLPTSVKHRSASALVQLCRINGCATIAAVMRLCLTGPAPKSGSSRLLLLGFAAFLAIALGNLVKEVSMAVCGHMVNWAGFDFRRTGLIPLGGAFRELWRPDGTRLRLVLRGREVVAEWTTPQGECHRKVKSLIASG